MEREPHFCLLYLLSRTSFFAVSTENLILTLILGLVVSGKKIIRLELLTGNMFLIKERLE